MTAPPQPAGTVRTIVVGGTTSVLGAIPAFLVGSLAVFIREELVFDQAQLGLAVGAFFLASALASIPGGRLTERVGARRALLGSGAVTGVAMLGVATLARSWTILVLWLMIAGAANGIAQPAGNLALARGVQGDRKALAFGIKQASIPAATLLSGAAVPLIGLTVGWRWAFAVGAAGALVVALIMPKDPYLSPIVGKGRALRQGDAPVLPLAVLALAATCGAAAGTSLASFYVESAVTMGFGAGVAGAMLVIGSLSGIASRLVLGWFADRRARGHLMMVTVVLAFGAIGFAGMAMTSALSNLLLPATILAFAAGWGWPGLFNFTVVKLNPKAPAAASAITQTGVFAGGVLGPAVFGAVAQNVSFEAAWLMAATLNLLGAGCVVLGRHLLRAHRLREEARSQAVGPADDFE